MSKLLDVWFKGRRGPFMAFVCDSLQVYQWTWFFQLLVWNPLFFVGWAIARCLSTTPHPIIGQEGSLLLVHSSMIILKLAILITIYNSTHLAVNPLLNLFESYLSRKTRSPLILLVKTTLSKKFSELQNKKYL